MAGSGIASLKNLPRTNTLAYIPVASVTQKKSLIPVTSEELRQSQYFDALETIKEEEPDETDHPDDLSDASDHPDHPADHSDDDWTDVSDEVEVTAEPKQKRKRDRLVFPEPVKRRVKALKKIQFETEKLEAR